MRSLERPPFVSIAGSTSVAKLTVGVWFRPTLEPAESHWGLALVYKCQRFNPKDFWEKL